MPTFSLISQPQQLAPVNAPLWYVGTSTNNQFPFFKYNFQLYKYNRYDLSDKTFLGQFKIPPRPDNNYGVFDAHKVLQSQVGSYNFTFSQVGLQPVYDDKSIVQYKALMGYEYNPNYQFINTFSYSFSGGYVKYYEDTQLYFIYNQSIGDQQLHPTYTDELFDKFSYIPTNGSSVYITFNDGVNLGYFKITYVNYISPFFFEVGLATPLTGSINLINPYDIKFYYIDNSVYVGLDFTDTNLLQQNDIITILMNDKNQNGSYNGQSSVIYQLSTTQSITSIPYGINPTGAETGIVNLLLRSSTSTDYRYAFPGTRQYTENNVDFGTTKEISYNKFATNYTDIKQIFFNQYETISIMSLNISNFSNARYQVKTYDGSFNLLHTYTSATYIDLLLDDAYSVKFELGTGTKQIHGWTMSGTPIDLGSASYYSVALVNSSPSFTAIATYSVVPNCSRYENVRIMFQNRVGGYDYWNFNYDSKWTIDINRTLYTKQLDYNYKIGDRGRTILNIDANVMYEANTDWISESDYNFLQELITSSDVYVIDETNGNKLPINIEDTQYVQKTALRDRLFNLKITYRYAYDLNLSGS